MWRNPMRLDQTLQKEIPLAQDAVKWPDSFGVEVELEGANVGNAGMDVMQYWGAHADHSLRDHHGQCVEYIFRRPFNMDTTKKAIDVLFDFLDSPDIKVHPSYRTSIHVHLNFGMETYRTIYNFITLSIILDELLVSQNGDHRIGNNFCLRAKDAMGQVNSLIQSVNGGHEFYGINQNERYSSINFASLMKFGSIEFRSLECTTHKGRVMHWINTLDHIKKVSKQFKDPTDVIGQFSQVGLKDFLFMVLGPYALKYSSVPDMEEMLRNGMRIAQDFAYCSEWKAMKPGDIPVIAPKPAKNKKVFYNGYENNAPMGQVLDQILANQQLQQGVVQVVPDPEFIEDDFDDPAHGWDEPDDDF